MHRHNSHSALLADKVPTQLQSFVNRALIPPRVPSDRLDIKPVHVFVYCAESLTETSPVYENCERQEQTPRTAENQEKTLSASRMSYLFVNSSLAYIPRARLSTATTFLPPVSPYDKSKICNSGGRLVKQKSPFFFFNNARAFPPPFDPLLRDAV